MLRKSIPTIRAGLIAACTAGLLLLTQTTSVAVPGGPANDDCTTPDIISGNGPFSFDTSGATTGVEGQLCSGAAGTIGIDNDVWFQWIAPCDGIINISTCGLAQFDTKIAIYDQMCPDDSVPPLCCNDDFCDLQSAMDCQVVCGTRYTIQIGSAPGTPGGPGSFEIATVDCVPGCDEPCCVTFDDGTTNGFGPCPFAPNVDVSVSTPGPSGLATDSYLRLRDQSNASLACGVVCEGDWTQYGPCTALCFDFQVFNDGCTPNNPDCQANGGWIPITPKIIISNGTVRAVFNASFTVTDPSGPNPGWHTACAPIGPLDSSGNLPNNANGYWVMAGGAPNSDWNSLITNVTEVQLPIDFTANPAEIAGYDNICLRDDVCPCMEIIDEEIQCDLDPTGQPTGTYTLNYSVTNLSGVDAHYMLIPDPNVTPNVIPISPPLPGDGSQTANFTVTITNGTPGEPYCFDVILADQAIDECCSTDLCVELPECDCMLIREVELDCDPATGELTLSFNVFNLTPDVVEHMFLVPQTSGVTITPDYVDVPSMGPFTGQGFGPFTITGATTGDVLCIRVAIHDEILQECCSEDLCFTVPNCTVVSNPCDLDQNGEVNVLDLLILLADWGPCNGPCAADLNQDGTVNVLDLLLLLGTWG